MMNITRHINEYSFAHITFILLLHYLKKFIVVNVQTTSSAFHKVVQQQY